LTRVFCPFFAKLFFGAANRKRITKKKPILFEGDNKEKQKKVDISANSAPESRLQPNADTFPSPQGVQLKL
jgi:hypothetical protein